MGEAESLEEAQKYSLALEQEIQGIEEYLQILQEMISTGGYQMYKKEQVDIRELTGQFRERIEAAAAGKKQTIQFECENLPKWICVNEKLLIRSWENLVYNAIEYTPQGGMIRICISEGKEQLEISVEDEGLSLIHIYYEYHCTGIDFCDSILVYRAGKYNEYTF